MAGERTTEELLDEIDAWLDEHGRTGEPMLDGIRYAAAHSPIDLRVIEVPSGARAR